MDEKILSRIRRKMTLDADFMKDCTAYDSMESMSWDLPAGLAVHEWVRKRVSTEAHDILKTATNLFDVHHPKWEILPRGPADADQAEELERWLEWHMLLANRHGDQEAFRQMLRYSTKYNRITAQLDYLPYWISKDSEEWADAINNPFCIKTHNPANVRYEMGSYGLRWVAAVSNIPAAECIDHWDAYQGDSKYGKKIKAALKKIETLLENDEEARLMYVDYTDKKKRWVFAYVVPNEQVDVYIEPPEGKDGKRGEFIEIMDGDNELGFINWVISVGTSDPLLYSMHHGGLWENQCFLDTIADSVVLRRAFFPLIKHSSASGKPLEVDYTGAEAVIEMNAADGESAEVMSPPPLDPGIREMMDRNSQKGASATGLKGLQNVEMGGDAAFASVNARIQLSKATLDPYIRNFEKAAVELARLVFLWIHKSDNTITGYRTKTKNVKKNKVKGQKINIGKNDFDPKTMVIQCELLSNAPSDEMQRMNVYSQAVQIGLPIPKKQIVERMDWGEGDVLEADWIKEQVQQMALANFQKRMEGMTEIELAQLMQATQQPPPQAAPPPQALAGMSPPEQMNSGAAPGMIPEGMGNDPAMQGTPPAMSAPQMTTMETRRPQ